MEGLSNQPMVANEPVAPIVDEPVALMASLYLQEQCPMTDKPVDGCDDLMAQEQRNITLSPTSQNITLAA
jgi:hypothetical protein